MDLPICVLCQETASFLCLCEERPACLCVVCLGRHVLDTTLEHRVKALGINSPAYERSACIQKLSDLLTRMQTQLNSERRAAEDTLYQLYIDKQQKLHQMYQTFSDWAGREYAKLSSDLSQIMEDLKKMTGSSFRLETTVFISAAEHLEDVEREFLPLQQLFDRHVVVELNEGFDTSISIPSLIEQWRLSPPCQCSRCRRLAETLAPPDFVEELIHSTGLPASVLAYKECPIYKSMRNIGAIEETLRRRKGQAAVLLFRQFACELGEIPQGQIESFVSFFFTSQHVDEGLLRRALQESGLNVQVRFS